MISEFIFIALLVLMMAVGTYNSVRHFQRTWVARGGDPRRGWRRGALSIVSALGGAILFLTILGAVYHAFNWPGALIVTGASLAFWVAIHSMFFTPPGRVDKKHPTPDATASSHPDDSTSETSAQDRSEKSE
ncbi:hypothetical protein [Varunaivibrio sulfuroxidans]|uniref:DUF3325 domain-containing protein n=1 Tax=Varunaivibrio sulfuroxidans TaxID=1773489 RepID=A0A4R3J544_9PROT|nr:hypothetical protein [Varunaivibrio sulfuroxidans]TCS60928.1 hypothetical protein EDD55_10988 [Varunaivibrio sulfuroxidans]WES31664.1 hypothetical protein P3M64_04645 [Varunaivibrio sulfuroxidans]